MSAGQACVVRVTPQLHTHGFERERLALSHQRRSIVPSSTMASFMHGLAADRLVRSHKYEMGSPNAGMSKAAANVASMHIILFKIW